jgi:PAS domain S-box-containing protein
VPPPSERRSERAFSRADDPIFVIDRTRDRIRYANRCACSMLGYDVAELLALPASRLFGGEGPAVDAFLSAIETHGHGWTTSLALRTNGGAFLPAEVVGFRVRGDEHGYVLVLASDRSRHRDRPD